MLAWHGLVSFMRHLQSVLDGNQNEIQTYIYYHIINFQKDTPEFSFLPYSLYISMYVCNISKYLYCKTVLMGFDNK